MWGVKAGLRIRAELTWIRVCIQDARKTGSGSHRQDKPKQDPNLEEEKTGKEKFDSKGILNLDVQPWSWSKQNARILLDPCLQPWFTEKYKGMDDLLLFCKSPFCFPRNLSVFCIAQVIICLVVILPYLVASWQKYGSEKTFFYRDRTGKDVQLDVMWILHFWNSD